MSVFAVVIPERLALLRSSAWTRARVKM